MTPGPTEPQAAASPTASPFDPDLEAMLPSELRGVHLNRFSGPLSTFATRGSDMCILLCGDEPGRLADAAGTKVEDMAIGLAVPADGSDLAVQIIAIRFPGVATERLVPIRLRAGGHSAGVREPPAVTKFPVGTDEVTYVEWWPTFVEAGQHEYLYAVHDVLFLIGGIPPEKGAAARDVVLAVEALERAS